MRRPCARASCAITCSAAGKAEVAACASHLQPLQLVLQLGFVGEVIALDNRLQLLCPLVLVQHRRRAPRRRRARRRWRHEVPARDWGAVADLCHTAAFSKHTSLPQHTQA